MKMSFTRLVKNTGFQHEYNSRGLSKENPKDIIQAAWLFSKSLARSMKNRASGRLELDYAELYVTTHCSLRCRDCAVLIPYLQDHQHFTRESLIEDMERFFQAVNYVHRFGLVGGEPFLHPDLADLIVYLIGHSRVGTIRIPTNGTVLPGPDLIKVMKSTPRVLVSISGYPPELCPQRPHLIDLLDQNNIRYEYYNDQTWSDLGGCDSAHRQPDKPSLKQLARRFSDCWMTSCHGILQGRFYLCGRAAFAPLAGIHDAFPEDYVDLHSLNSIEQTRRGIANLMGRPFLQACSFCRGTSAMDIAPAVQVTVD